MHGKFALNPLATLMTAYQEALLAHYVRQWGTHPAQLVTQRPSVRQVPATFRVLEFTPTPNRTLWTYATCGMSSPETAFPLELHLFSSRQCSLLVDLLTTVAHYHQTAHPLGLDHTVNFGVAWQAESACSYGLLSLPYLDGPLLEKMPYQGHEAQCLWLIPITAAERDFKVYHGMEALEDLFEQTGFDYANPTRLSVV
jgi:hypothetical protein